MDEPEPFYLTNHVSRPARSVETLWTLARGTERASCTIARDEQAPGVEAQITRGDEFLARRFPSRLLAGRWADSRRAKFIAAGFAEADPVTA